jgi:hypothetical protein
LHYDHRPRNDCGPSTSRFATAGKTSPVGPEGSDGTPSRFTKRDSSTALKSNEAGIIDQVPWIGRDAFPSDRTW